ncbi:hypothetical protein EYF80_013834 [Liparis tanakae]|uniref:Uncharacterized protein n=1 Tax=Liparis tanakae TaxID=230148 RepID=A0A4Z2IEJ3_9TELE|nr:hypothetical protein EYF80_013834 [Liparis tanakae]
MGSSNAREGVMRRRESQDLTVNTALHQMHNTLSGAPVVSIDLAEQIHNRVIGRSFGVKAPITE